MEDTKSILKRYNVKENVNVNNNIDNVNVEELVRIVNEAIDKPRAIAETLADKLNAPGNIKFYIKLASQHSHGLLFECLALTKEADREGRVKTDLARYFYGILRNKVL